MKTEIIYFENTTRVFKFAETFKSPIDPSTIVITQASSALIFLSVVALIANIDNKYIFGEQSLNLIGKKFFKIISISIYAMPLSNIYFLLIKSNEGLIICNFILFLILIFILINKFSNLYIGQSRIRKKLLYNYYKANLKHLKKARPLNNHLSPLTMRFKYITIKHIRNNDVPRYNDNINAYFLLLELNLFNDKKLIQEYYTEGITHEDFISHILQIAQGFYDNHKFIESINICTRLFSKLNYYKVVICQHNLIILSLLSEFNQHIKNTINEQETIKCCKLFYTYIDEIIYQVYLYSIIDLNYCRLFKYNLIYFFPTNDMWENIYNAIFENKSLNDIEKQRVYVSMFDHIRMAEHNEKYPSKNIDDFLNNQDIPTPQLWSLEIKAEPIALLFLRMFELKDSNNIDLFCKMNISDRLMSLIKILTFISILNILSKDNKREYVMDLNIDTKSTIQIMKGTKFFSIKIKSYNQIKFLYNLIYNKYTCIDGKYCDGSFYHFSPKLCFCKTVVDTFFKELATIHNFDTDFIKDGVFDKKVENIIKKIAKNNQLPINRWLL